MTARSPNYPRWSIEEAIDGVRDVYAAERRRELSETEVARKLGYEGIGGTSRGAVSSLRKYGLLQTVSPGKLRVSDEALAILFPETDSDKKELIEAAAFTPKPFHELYTKWGSKPPSNEDLQRVLAKRGYLEKAIPEVGRIYRNNLKFVFGEAAGYTEARDQAAKQPSEGAVQSPQSVNGSSASRASESGAHPAVSGEQGSLQELLHVFAKGSEVRLYAGGDVSPRTIDRIIAHLELLKDGLPSAGPREQGGEPPTLESTE